MRRETARRGSSICAAAATAVSAVGFSLASASMLPAAHAACEDWTLGPTVWEIVLDNVSAGEVKVEAFAEDAAGNVEKRPHMVVVK